MEANKILDADILDIIFERMNKSYGAYELRKSYNKRLTKALLITAIAAILLIGGMVLSRILSKYITHKKVEIADVSLVDVKDKAPPPPAPPPPPPPKVEPPKIEIKAFTPPKIVDKPDEKKEVKKQEDLDNTTIGKIDQVGLKAPDVVNPPKVDVGSKVVAAPADDDNKVFTKVEIEAKFPGGDQAWHDYVQKAIMQHMDELQEDGKSGTCEVQFIVDKDGVVSEVQALTMQGSKLAEIAVNSIRRGPHWEPAQQNGRKVKAFRRQKITFTMPEE
jgi:periplasmic protein TonB